MSPADVLPPDAPPVTVRALWTPKSDHDAAEYEDAHAADADAWPVMLAVTDGATESAFARAWARYVAEALVAERVADADALAEALPRWQTTWTAKVAGDAEALPWYAAAKASEGAFAAVVSVALHADGTFHALAVGDCDVLHFRGLALRQAWPLSTARAFTHRPALLPSQPTAEVPAPETLTGRWQPGDAFALASDAVAAWLLGHGPAVALALDTPFDFALAVEIARGAGTCRDDDSTLVVARLGSGQRSAPA